MRHLLAAGTGHRRGHPAIRVLPRALRQEPVHLPALRPRRAAGRLLPPVRDPRGHLHAQQGRRRDPLQPGRQGVGHQDGQRGTCGGSARALLPCTTI